MPGLFVTATDTGAGKTLVSCALLAGLAACGLKTAGFKPVAAGAHRTPKGLRNEDAELLRSTLVGRYRVPYDQVKLVKNPSLDFLIGEIPQFLAQADREDWMVIYFAGYAYQDDGGVLQLITKDLALWDMREVLKELIERLEACPAKEKVFLVDCFRFRNGEQERERLQTLEILRSLAGHLRTVKVIAPSDRLVPRGCHRIFARCLCDGFSGRADLDGDNRITVFEVFDQLRAATRAEAGKRGVIQTPQLLQPSTASGSP